MPLRTQLKSEHSDEAAWLSVVLFCSSEINTLARASGVRARFGRQQFQICKSVGPRGDIEGNNDGDDDGDAGRGAVERRRQTAGTMLAASVLTSSPSSTLNIAAPPSSQLRRSVSSTAIYSSNEAGSSKRCLGGPSPCLIRPSKDDQDDCIDIDEDDCEEEVLFARGAKENPIAISPSPSKSSQEVSPRGKRRRSAQPRSPSKASKLSLGTRDEGEELARIRQAPISKGKQRATARPLLDGEIYLTDEEDEGEPTRFRRHLSAFRMQEIDDRHSPKKVVRAFGLARDAGARTPSPVKGHWTKKETASPSKVAERPSSSSASSSSSKSSTSSSSMPLSMLARLKQPSAPVPIELPTTIVPLLRRMTRCPLCALDFEPNASSIDGPEEDLEQQHQTEKSISYNQDGDEVAFRPAKLPQRPLSKEGLSDKPASKVKTKAKKRVPKPKVLTGPARHVHIQSCARQRQQEQHRANVQALSPCKGVDRAKDEDEADSQIVIDVESVMRILTSEKDRLDRLERVREVERQQKRSVWDDVLGSQQMASTSGRGAKTGKFATSTTSNTGNVVVKGSGRKASPSKKTVAGRGSGRRCGGGVASTTVLAPGSTKVEVYLKCVQLFGEEVPETENDNLFDWTFAEHHSTLDAAAISSASSPVAQHRKNPNRAVKRQRYGLGLGQSDRDEDEREARLSMGLRLADDIAARFIAGKE